MGELSNGCGVIMMNEDCTGQDVTHSLRIKQKRNASSTQSSSGNEDEQMDGGEMTKRGFKGRSVQDKKNKQSQELLKQQVNDLAIQMTYLSHQVTLLLNALHVPSCQCGICKPYYQTQVEMFKLLKDGGASIPLSPNKIIDNNNKATIMAQNGFIEKNSMKTEVLKTSPSSIGAVTTGGGNIQTVTNVPSMNDCEALLSQIFTQTGLPLNGAQVAAAAAAATAGLPTAFGLATAAAGTSFTKSANGNPANKVHQNVNNSGRRSKYCSPEEKKAVAEYAEAHGPSAAARKFGIPTPVAAYYHRKEYKPKPSGVSVAPQVMPLANAGSPGTTSGDEMDSTNGDCQNGPIPSAVKFSGTNGSSKASEQQPKQNPAHSTGSPGFLRGRGRGRPKLIGDELDAELVDYMVQIKQSDPRGHLTASQALAIARAYIMEKAPGLLEEHGGQIKLKLTWAMKLVARISERQKEIEFGLPAGTISNMTSTFCSGYNYGTNPSLPGGNFMADVVAQNLLSQQMTQIMTQAVSGNHIYEQMKQIMSQSLLGGGSAPASATPQILNIRELELPKPDDGDLKGEIVDAAENDMKDEDMDVTGQQFDVDIENQAGNIGNPTGHKKTSAQKHFIPSKTF